MEKRLNILFDHLNNEDLLSESTVQEMVQISSAVKDREWDRALSLLNEMQTAKLDSEGTHWMVSSYLSMWCDVGCGCQLTISSLYRLA